jgi:hypothetical protein
MYLVSTSRYKLLFAFAGAFLALALSEHTFALDFSIGNRLTSGEVLFKPAIIMEGEIRDGDAARFLQFLRDNQKAVVDDLLSIVPNSPGGSVAEAMKIASIVEGGMFGVWLPSPKPKHARCASSCFLIAVAAPTRIIAPHTLGLHRPYFDQRVYSLASPSNAIQAHEKLLREMRLWLHNHGVPSQIVEKMMNYSSKEIYWMNEKDLSAFGVMRPSYEELLIGKCGYDQSLTTRLAEARERGDRSVADLATKWDIEGRCIEGIQKSAKRTYLAK